MCVCAMTWGVVGRGSIAARRNGDDDGVLRAVDACLWFPGPGWTTEIPYQRVSGFLVRLASRNNLLPW